MHDRAVTDTRCLPGTRCDLVELRPEAADPDSMPVQFIHVVGNPRASRLIVRPWLFARRR